MRHCWRDRPHDRPSFDQLYVAFSRLIEANNQVSLLVYKSSDLDRTEILPLLKGILCDFFIFTLE